MFFVTQYFLNNKAFFAFEEILNNVAVVIPARSDPVPDRHWTPNACDNLLIKFVRNKSYSKLKCDSYPSFLQRYRLFAENLVNLSKGVEYCLNLRKSHKGSFMRKKDRYWRTLTLQQINIESLFCVHFERIRLFYKESYKKVTNHKNFNFQYHNI